MTADPIQPYKAAFLHSCLDANVLSFGTYKLKSRRESPYFFNAGLFLNSASLFRSVQTAYAQCIIAYASKNPTFSFDVLFGVSTFMTNLIQYLSTTYRISVCVRD